MTRILILDQTRRSIYFAANGSAFLLTNYGPDTVRWGGQQDIKREESLVMTASADIILPNTKDKYAVVSIEPISPA